MKLKAILIAVAALALTACGGSGSSNTQVTDTCSELSGDSFNCESMLQDIQALVVSTVTSVQAELVSLNQDVATYCSGVTSTLAQGEAQAQFKVLMAKVQQLELMQFGPMIDFREQLYVWPSNNTCRADDQMVKRINGVNEVFSSARSLTAVEYMLFEEDTLDSCAITFPSTVGSWKTSTPDINDRKTARCEYAGYLLDDLVAGVGELKMTMDSYDITTEYSTLQQAINRISDALFYIDKQTKDAKIKAALPQTTEGVFTLNKIESQFANISKENIKNNLIAVRSIISAGLDDYLVVKDQQAMVTEMEVALDTAIANVDAITGDLYTLISTTANAGNSDDVNACINVTDYTLATNDLERYCALQASVKSFTDILKQDFVLALNFSTPASADGEND